MFSANTITLSHPNGKQLKLHKGFSWLGLLVPQFWSLLHGQWRLWGLSMTPILLLRVDSGILEYCSKTATPCDPAFNGVAILAVCIQLALMISYGVYGNRMALSNAKARGYLGF